MVVKDCFAFEILSLEVIALVKVLSKLGSLIFRGKELYLPITVGTNDDVYTCNRIHSITVNSNLEYR